MVRFMAKLAKLEPKSPVRTLLLAAGDGLGPPALKPAAPTEPPEGWRRSPNASNPKTKAFSCTIRIPTR